MPKDIVPDLLSRATELLQKHFAALPDFDPATNPAASAPGATVVARKTVNDKSLQF